MAKMPRLNYPSASLPECIESVKKIWKAEQRTAVTPHVIAKALGYRGLTGPAKTRLSALEQYGLLDVQDNGAQLSTLAMAILHAPPDSEKYSASLMRAAMNPESFKEIWQTHSDATDEALKSHLLRKKGFTKEGAKQFIKSFRDTIEAANIQETGENKSPLFVDVGQRTTDDPKP